MLLAEEQVHLKESWLVCSLHLILPDVHLHHSVHPPSLSLFLLEAQANSSLAFTLAKWQPQLTYCCVITAQHLAMPMRLEQKPSRVGGGFPQRPWQTRGWAMD